MPKYNIRTMTTDEPVPPPEIIPAAEPTAPKNPGFWDWMKNLLRNRNETSLREALSEFIEQNEEQADDDTITAHERLLLSNILSLREETVFKVMVPRADIFAIDIRTSQEELLSLLAQRQFSRIPVYKGTLDEVLGTIHIKDILAALVRGQNINISDLITEIPIVSPAMPLLDLLLTMRQSRRHMALVVDEFGGIDGLVTINDIIESIVGEIDDEHDIPIQAQMIEKPDGSIIADGRVSVPDFEQRFGEILTAEERESNDTLGGLVLYLAGHVPARGEIITHSSGMVFEILEADPRRVSRMRIRNIIRSAQAG
ncbi:MAG: hemolysin family protein [Alphaproteobacteria bacterium]|nr:hemolysin family protein [Alphaproteobacteria bacterium]